MAAPTQTTGTGIINGPVYKAAHYGTAYLNVPPNTHRLRNAVGLTVGLYLGRKTMDILTGQTPNGTKVDVMDLPLPLRPLHGILAYDHFSDDPAHRWMKVFDMCVPALLGGIGAGMGSISYFEKQGRPISKLTDKLPLAKEFTLGKAEMQALHIQGKASGFWSSLSAVFGSASGFGLFPSFLNYSSTLGTTFTIRAERSMVGPFKWFGKLFNAHSPYPFRPTRLIGEMVEYAAHNPGNAEQLDAYAHGILKTWFKGIKKEDQIKDFVTLIKNERANFVGKGLSAAESEKAISTSLKAMLTDTGLEKTLIDAKIDPRDISIGDMGIVSSILHLLGVNTKKQMTAARKLLHEGLEERHGATLLKEFGAKAFDPKHAKYADDALKKLGTAAFIGTGAATIGGIALAKDTAITDLDGGEDKKAGTFADKVLSGTSQHVVHSKKDRGLINGKLLDTVEGITGMFNAAIGIHRVHCAIGLTVGSWLGDEVMKALTGIDFAGKQLPEDKIMKPLRKLYKSGKDGRPPLHFQPHGDHMNDKWMQVLRWAIPGIVGGVAVMQGSKMFFEKRHATLKKAQYLDEVEDKATMAQSQPWSYTSAISSLCGYPTGMPMMPLVNYSTNLGTRFSMASGRKVAMPIVGKWWSNNSTLFPFGPAGMTNLLIREAVGNKAFDPELFETYAIGILKPWFDNVTAQQIESFVMKIHEVRDRFFKEGGVPEDMKKQLEAEMRAHFKGAGLEETMQQIGLDPLKATIANNGMSGTIANILGAKGKVEKIKAEYAKGYRERLEKREKDAPPAPGIST